MKFYRLSWDSDTRNVGESPQGQESIKFGDVQNFGIGSPGVIDDIDLPEPILHKKAILTDYLDIVAISSNLFMVIHERFLDFIKSFYIGKYQAWPILIHHKSKQLTDYYLFRLNDICDEDYVDYHASEFFIEKGGLGLPIERIPVQIHDYQEFIRKREEIRNQKEANPILKSYRTILNLSNAKKDLFRLYETPSCGGYYISERLKNAIEEAGLTGMAFKEIHEYNKRIEVRYGTEG